MQKKVISLLFVAAICAMVFVGCKKDTEVVTLGVQNEVSYNGKVYIDNSYNPCFLQVGEQVNVNGESYDVEYDATSGQYKVSCQSNEDGNYYAVYPATNSCTGSTCTIALPHYQQYDCDASGVQNVNCLLVPPSLVTAVRNCISSTLAHCWRCNGQTTPLLIIKLRALR